MYKTSNRITYRTDKGEYVEIVPIKMFKKPTWCIFSLSHQEVAILPFKTKQDAKEACKNFTAVDLGIYLMEKNNGRKLETRHG